MVEREDSVVLPSRIEEVRMFALGFDLETAFMGDFSTWSPAKKMGISCGGVLSTLADWFVWEGHQEPELTKSPDGSLVVQHSPKLSVMGAKTMLATLKTIMDGGGWVITWNGLKFDWQVLGIEANEIEIASNLATSSQHIDLMLLFCSVNRHPLGLKSAAEGCGSSKGGGGIESGDLAAPMWAKGEREKVLAYLKQDCQATLDVFNYLLDCKGFPWMSKSGRPQQFVLTTDLQDPIKWSVEKVLQRQWNQPPSWISTPSKPEHFTDWLVIND